MNYMASINFQPVRGAGADSHNHVTHAKLLSGYGELVSELGGNPDLLLDGVGLTRLELAQPNAMIYYGRPGNCSKIPHPCLAARILASDLPSGRPWSRSCSRWTAC